MINPPVGALPLASSVSSGVSSAVFSGVSRGDLANVCQQRLAQGPLQLRCLQPHEEGLLLLNMEPAFAAAAERQQQTAKPLLEADETTCTKALETTRCSSLGPTSSCLLLADAQSGGSSSAAADPAAAAAAAAVTPDSSSALAAQHSELPHDSSKAFSLEQTLGSSSACRSHRAASSSSISCSNSNNRARGTARHRSSSSSSSRMRRPRDTQMVETAITKALMRLTAASQKAAAAAAAGGRRWMGAPRPSTASPAAGGRRSSSCSRSPSAVSSSAAAASAAAAAAAAAAADAAAKGGTGRSTFRPGTARPMRCPYTAARQGGQKQTPARHDSAAESAAAAVLQQQQQQHLLRQQALQELHCNLEEGEPPLEVVLQMCSSETLEELLQPLIRRLKALLQQLLIEADGGSRVLFGQGVLLAVTLLVFTLDREIAAYQRYAGDLEAVLGRWQQRELHAQQLLQRLQQLQQLVASHERLRAEERRRHEETEAALSERIEELQREIGKLDPDVALVSEMRDRHEELLALLQRREAAQQVQHDLLLQAQQLLQTVSQGRQQPMANLRDRDTGRVYETKEGELCFRPHAVAESGVLVKTELLSAPLEGRGTPPVCLLLPRLRVCLTRHTTLTHGPPAPLPLEELLQLAAAAYDRKAAADAAAAAAGPLQCRVQRLSLAEALEETLTFKLSAEEKVQHTLARLTQALLLLQRQHQQQKQQQHSRQPSLSSPEADALRFGRLLGVCTLEDYLPLPCLNLFLCVRRRLQAMLLPPHHQGEPRAASSAADAGKQLQQTAAAASAAAPSAAGASVANRPYSSAPAQRPPAAFAAAANGSPEQQDAPACALAGSSSSSSSKGRSRDPSSAALLPAVSLFVLAVDLLEGTRETAASALLLGLSKHARPGSPGSSSLSAIQTPRKQQQRSPRSPRLPPAAATAAPAAAATATARWTETVEGRARVLLCGLLHHRLQQERLNLLRKHLTPVAAACSKQQEQTERAQIKRGPPTLTLAIVQAVSCLSALSKQGALHIYKEMQRLRDCCTREQQIFEAHGSPWQQQPPPLDASAAAAASLLLLRAAAANSGWLVRSHAAAVGLPLSVPQQPPKGKRSKKKGTSGPRKGKKAHKPTAGSARPATAAGSSQPLKTPTAAAAAAAAAASGKRRAGE
ncbi:hypothetical protein Efla_005377 [Eimeria flavescens]